MIIDLINNQSNPTIAPYAKNGEVHFRITASANNTDEANSLITPILKELEVRFADNIYSENEDETLEDVVVKLLKDKKLTLCTAESCTGGLLGGRIINVAGASDVYMEGYITYSNKAKIKNLNVNPNTLNTYGAVSQETAKEMAIGAANVSGASVAVAVTGIAGPGDRKATLLVALTEFQNSFFADGEGIVLKEDFLDIQVGFYPSKLIQHAGDAPHPVPSPSEGLGPGTEGTLVRAPSPGKYLDLRVEGLPEEIVLNAEIFFVDL